MRAASSSIGSRGQAGVDFCTVPTSKWQKSQGVATFVDFVKVKAMTMTSSIFTRIYKKYKIRLEINTTIDIKFHCYSLCLISLHGPAAF